MPEGKSYISSRIRNIIIAALALIYALFCTWGFIATRSWINRPFPGFLILENNIVLFFNLPEWEGPKSSIKFYDVIVSVDGLPVASADEVMSYIGQHQPGDPITYDILRKHQRFQSTIPVSIFTLKDYLLFFLVMKLIGFVFYAMGLIVFYLKYNSRPTWSFLLFSVMVGLALAATPELCTINSNFIFYICFPLVGPSGFLFVLFFPVETKYPRYLILLVFASALPLIYLHFHYSTIAIMYYYINNAATIYLILLATISTFIMSYSFAISSDPLIRQKAKMFIYGCFVVFLGFLIATFIILILRRINLYIFYSLAIVTVMIPLSLGYSIVKHNLFDVDAVIRRTFSYLLVSGIVVVLFFGLIITLSLALQKITGQSSQIAAVLSTLFMIILFRPFRDRVDRIIDRRFFREKYEYQDTIRKTSEHLVTIIDLQTLQHQLIDTVLNAIKIDRGAIILREGGSDTFHTGAARGFDSPDPFGAVTADHPLLKHLEKEGRALQRNDIEEFDRFAEDREQMLAALKTFELVLVIPIRYEQRLIGVLGLSAKKSGAWYSSEDIDLLQTLMNSTASSIMNAQKVEESKVARFLSPVLAKAIVHNFDEITRIRRKRLTVFFSDIRGFTTLSDEMEPEEMIERLNHYLREMTEIIFAHGGTLDKFMGDGIMVFFNDPVDQSDHAVRAVRMSVAMQRRMDELQSQWFKAGHKPLAIGIGINTGYVTVGGIGSDQHMDYTVIGNQVNLAARLQGLAQGGEIIISHATYGEVSELVETEDRGEVAVKGLHQPVKIYNVKGLK